MLEIHVLTGRTSLWRTSIQLIRLCCWFDFHTNIFSQIALITCTYSTLRNCRDPPLTWYSCCRMPCFVAKIFFFFVTMTRLLHAVQ